MNPASSNTVIGVFSSAEQAMEALKAIRQTGVPGSSIGMAIRAHEGDPPGESAVTRDAEVGAAAGGAGGALLGLVSAAVPGVGPVLIIGPMLAALGGAGLGAVAGGIIGALAKLGVPHEEAGIYAESLRRGDAILTVRAGDRETAERVVAIMNRNGAADVNGRAANWRRRGWAGHQAGLEPLSEDELRREQEYYASGEHKEWTPETDAERRHAGYEPGTMWPHEVAHDLGESLVEVAAESEPLQRRARIYEIEPLG